MSPPLPVIVGAAILDRSGRVLAAERSAPPELAGLWEFPGGKVEPGEGEIDALVRECTEELGVTIEVGDRLGDDVPIADGRAVLRIWTAALVGDAEPRALEHRSVRWLGVHDLDDVPWLPADAPLVDELRRVLSARPSC